MTNYKRLEKPIHLRNKRGLRGGHTTGIYDMVPYLFAIGSCVFDCRHFVYDTISGVFPFPVTCRIISSSQQFLFIEYDI